MKYNHGFFSPWFFFVRFSVSCFFKMRKVFLLNELDCLLIEARFIRRISAVSNSIQLSAAEMRQLIHTSNFYRI